MTVQKVRVRMTDYKRFIIYATNVNQKINVRANILHCGTSDQSKLILN